MAGTRHVFNRPSHLAIAVSTICCAGLAAAFPAPYLSPGPRTVDHGASEDPYQSHSYHFRYAVNDPVTGDVKDHNEVSDGRGNVRGTYSLFEADGSRRVVEYTADDVHGFRAEVKRIEPLDHDRKLVVPTAERKSYDKAVVATAARHESSFKMAVPGRVVPFHPAPVHDKHADDESVDSNDDDDDDDDHRPAEKDSSQH